MANISLSVIIPVYNEENRLADTLEKVNNFLSKKEWDYEIIIVDDGSEDETADLAEIFVNNHARSRLIKNPHRGKAFAVRTGVLEAKKKFVYFADADLATPINEVEKMIGWLQGHDFDIAIASREAEGAQRIGEPWYRHIIGRVFNCIVQVVVLPGLNDTQCGFKLFKKRAAEHIFKNLKIYGDDMEDSRGAFFGAFDVEVLFLARKFGYKVKEVPVVWKYQKTTRLNLISNSWKMFRDVVKVRLYDLRGRYEKECVL